MWSLRACGTSIVVLVTLLSGSSAPAWAGGSVAGSVADLAGASRPADIYSHLCYTAVRQLKTLRPSSTRTYSYDALTLQNALVYLDFPPPVPIKLDGWYGPATASAVKAYQRSRRLVVDGIVGPQTWRKLRSEIC